MAVSIVMPALEMAQETGKIISWLKKEGDSIAKGEPIAEIETDKVVLEMEATADGVLAGVTCGGRRCGPGGQDHRVDRRAGRKASGGSSEHGTRRADDERTSQRNCNVRRPRPPAARQKLEVKVSPKARRMAQELGVDLEQGGRNRPGWNHQRRRCAARRGRTQGRFAASRCGSSHGAQLHRAPDGRAHHAELDHSSALLPGSRNRRERA